MTWCVTLAPVVDANGITQTMLAQGGAYDGVCGVVVLDRAELESLRASGALWGLSTVDGSALAAACLLVLATGYIFRVLIQTLKEKE